ncbi:MAG: hypothetical protein ACE5SW_11670 [Nitrososphaeraceae archaeon]
MSVILDMEKEVQTSLRMPKDLLKRGKQYALENDISFASVVIKALEEYLDRNTK